MGKYYGLVKPEHAVDFVTAVVDVLGGGENACSLMLETAMTETHLGALMDPTRKGAGTGLCQNDELPFYDTIRRTRAKHQEAVLEAFNIEVMDIKWEELENSPLLSFIACRLVYKLVPESIPDTIEGRAAYWKKYYNTSAGKGTVEKYIENAKKLYE